MGKRRRSEVNESEGEDPTTVGPTATQQAKRTCTDKWSFPDELQSAVGGQ